MDDGLGAIEVDARAELHKGVIFFQHRASRYTVAVERESGEILGASPFGSAEPDVVTHVMREVRRYQQSREVVHCEAARERVRRKEAEADDKPSFGARLRERV
jgi:hypothetical protein